MPRILLYQEYLNYFTFSNTPSQNLFTKNMIYSPELIALGNYLAGEFDNQPQATSEPIWYVHLHLWHQPVSLFTEDSLTLFAEQANIVKLDQPYRPRIIRLRQLQSSPVKLQIEYYMLKEMSAFAGAGRNRELLQNLTTEDMEFLPGCTLLVNIDYLSGDGYQFQAHPGPGSRCCFTYQGNTYQVALGLTVNQEQLETFDKGINPETGQAIWGALMGPYRYRKIQDFSHQFPLTNT